MTCNNSNSLEYSELIKPDTSNTLQDQNECLIDAATSSRTISDDFENTNIIPRSRQPQRQDSFNKKYFYEELPELNVLQRFKEKWTTVSVLQFLQFFPILDWLPNYSVKRDLPNDIVSGLTVGVMHLPQGLAYAMLAGVPPITGLYMAVFPVIVYAIMGTSHHISMGTLSIVCIMASNAVFKYSTPEYSGFVNTTSTESFVTNGDDDEVQPRLTPVQVATAVCFTVGICQLLMGIFKLGILSMLLSDTLMSGFTTAAVVHVVASQLKNLTGIKVGSYNGLFKIFCILRDLVKNYKSINLVTTGISVVTISLLALFTELIKPIIERRYRYPFPIELTAIIIGTILSSSLQINTKYGVKTVGNIPLGLPSPQAPPFWLIPSIIRDGITIAIVAFSINLSMASILAKKGNYSIKANQELLASGAGNVVASFFACLPFAASLSRSVIQQNVGGKTQLASLVSCLLLLLVLLVIGPFFEPLPNCVLASIVVVALRKMYDQFKDLPKAWRKSRLDGTVWFLTFSASVILDIDYGLAIGITTSIISLLYFSQRINVFRLGNVTHTDLYLDLQHYKAAKEIPGICIIQIAGGLHFANKDYIIKKLYKLVGLAMSNLIEYTDETDCDKCEKDIQNEHNKVHCLVLDMQGVCFIDPSAADALILMRIEMEKTFGISMVLANCQGQIIKSLYKYKFFTTDFPASNVFPSIQDAVYHAQSLTSVL